MCVCVFARGRQVIINIHDLWVFYSKVSAWKITAPIFPLTTHSPSPIRSCNNIEIDHNQVLTAAAVNNTQRNWIFLSFLLRFNFHLFNLAIIIISSSSNIHIMKKSPNIFLLLSSRRKKKEKCRWWWKKLFGSHSTHPSASC